jgi:hypothetical protein
MLAGNNTFASPVREMAGNLTPEIGIVCLENRHL